MTALLVSILLAAPAPPSRVKVDTSKGRFVIEVVPAWAPRAAKRFLELVRSGYYDDSRFFRVVPGKWAQFGISGDAAVASKHRDETFADEGPEANEQVNRRGTVAFAFALPDSRGTQVFVNLADNERLDGQGFAPFGRVVQGMDVVESLYGGYGEASGGGIRGGKQDALFAGGNKWLDEHFPLLDHLLHARISR
jgi:cyclophilin family peptidyl-prolyl cis-trans isomerase